MMCLLELCVAPLISFALICVLRNLGRLPSCRSLPAFSPLYALLILFSISLPSDAQYVVEVLERTIAGYRAVLRCDATGADFGTNVQVFSYGVNATGCPTFTNPHDCCVNPKPPRLNSTVVCANYFALVPRGNCSFSEKAYHAQMARPVPYAAVMIFNDEGHSPVPMAGSKYADLVDIPVVMVSYTCMDKMMGQFPPEGGYVVAMRAIPGYYDLVKYIIPFVAIVGFCFAVLFISLVVRLCRERRRIARKRLSRSNLKKLPTRKFRKGEEPETCAVCLEDFAEGEKLRVLPCKHAYHCKCIDPWLTKNRKVCPICKRKVWSSGDSESSDSDAERRNPESVPSTSNTPTTRENAPLLSNAQPVASSLVPLVGSREGSGERFRSDGEGSSGSGGRRETTHAVVHAGDMDLEAGGNNSSSESPYRETVIGEDGEDGGAAETGHVDGILHRSSSALSETLRTKIRPFVQNLANKALRTIRRDEPSAQPEHAELENERNFAAENSAFDDISEGTPVRGYDEPQVKFAAAPSSSEEEEPEEGGKGAAAMRAVCEPPPRRPHQRRRHPAAGRFTQAGLDLDKELPSTQQQQRHTPPQGTSHTARERPRKVHRAGDQFQSSRSMPQDLPTVPFTTMTSEVSRGECLEDSDLEGHEPASRQRSRDDGVFNASFDLGDDAPQSHQNALPSCDKEEER